MVGVNDFNTSGNLTQKFLNFLHHGKALKKREVYHGMGLLMKIL